MRKAVVMALLALVSGSAAAEWTRVIEEAPEDASNVYVDFATIRKTRNTVKLWSLLDLKKVSGNAGPQFLSMKTQTEFDCKEESARMLYFSMHSSHMGKGEIVASSAKPGAWEPVPPGSIITALWKIACGKR